MDDTKILEQIRRTFQAGMVPPVRILGNSTEKSHLALKELTGSSSIFSTDDIEWLFQKSYNLALLLVKSARYIPAIELINTSLKVRYRLLLMTTTNIIRSWRTYTHRLRN